MVIQAHSVMVAHWSLGKSKLDTIVKGRLGYNLLERELLKRGWELFVPLLENGKIDCIALKDNAIIKLQIKTIQKEKSGRKLLPVRKISHNQGEYKVHLYSKDEIDFFIGSDVETEDLYVVPIEFASQYKSNIGMQKLAPYKNNFDLLEPYIGNNISGADDIGETLTGNTEGR